MPFIPHILDFKSPTSNHEIWMKGVAPNGAEVVSNFVTHDFPPSFFLKVENYGVAGIMGQ